MSTHQHENNMSVVVSGTNWAIEYICVLKVFLPQCTVLSVTRFLLA